MSKFNFKPLALLALAFGAVACTPAEQALNEEKPQEITCYSGGIKVHEGIAPGGVDYASGTNIPNYVYKDASGGAYSVPKSQCYVKTLP